MELLYVRVVAETVRPPAGDEVQTASRHGLEKVIAAVSSAGKLGGFFGGGLSVSGGVFGGGQYFGIMRS